MLIVEPGAFRTNFLGAFKLTSASSLEHYASANGVIERFKGSQPGDAEKGAARIVEAVSRKGLAANVLRDPKGKAVRLPLGPDCVRRYEGKMEKFKADLEAAKEASLSTNVDD